jgi:hypothetical protein
MKYFTPERYVRLGDLHEESAFRTATEDWEQALTAYRTRLREIQDTLPASLRQLLQSFSLHDADVLTMGQQGLTYVIVLRLDPCHRDLVLNYTLAEEPSLDRSALPPEHCSPHVEWLYDEIELAKTEPPVFDHSILLSNGWELRLRFTDLQVIPFRSLLLSEAEERRAAESERLGEIRAKTLHPAAAEP